MLMVIGLIVSRSRMGNVAWEHLGGSADFTKCLHSLGDLSPDRRYILHFPQDNEVWSIGSGYGGLKDTTIRIGHMGDHTIGALEELLGLLGALVP